MSTQLLIDADFVLFRDASAAQRENTFTNDAGHTLHYLHASFEEVRDNFVRSVEGYLQKLFANDAVLVFSGTSNFRKEVWPLYKANRAATRKPLAYYATIDFLREEGRWPVVLEDCLEGDDYIGILATRPSSTRRVIVSEDKDMQTLPNVEIYRQGKVVETTVESADHYWRLQTLMGDTTDGYAGCPGIGPKSAETILNKPGDAWENILAAYRDGCRKKPEALTKAEIETPEELALVNARLARILRYTDWDGKARRPILWTPVA